MKQFFIKLNRGIAWVQVKVLSPILLAILWLLIFLSSLIPRLLGTEFLRPFRRGGDTHWTEHPPIDTSFRGMRRQG